MPKLSVRRSGNSIAVPLPHRLARDLGLKPGDEVIVRIERIPHLLDFAGALKGRLSADEFTMLSNEGEDIG